MKRVALLALLLSLTACPKPDDAEKAGPPADTPAAAPPSKAVATEAPAKPLQLIAWTGKEGPEWAEVKKLEGEQKYQAAITKVGELLKAAQKAKNSEEIVRAIVRTVQLRIGLHGYETAVRFLDEVEWPTDLLGDTTVRLFFAQSLVTYANAYSWEIRKREKVVSKGPVDLKKWTWEQIHQHANKQFRAAWQQREGLGAQSLTVVDDYLKPNDYPRAIRATVRDAVTYLWVAHLANSSTWRPEQQSKVHTLDLGALLAETMPIPALDDPAVHPLVKLTALLADLEAWHRGEKRVEAAFEARRRRLIYLHAAITDKDDRAAIRKSLTAALDSVKGKPWWSLGMATLAELVEESGDDEALIEARRIALEGKAAFPDSVGGKRCNYIATNIEAPAYTLEGMAQDAPKKRSIGVRHKNLKTLYFRAYRFNLEAHVTGQKDYNLLPSGRQVEAWVDNRNPIAEWTVELPATTDYRMHRTWVTPPIGDKGSYVIAATPDKGFNRMAAPMQLTVLTLSDLVIVHHMHDGQATAQVFDGPGGAPVEGVTMRLYRHDWRNGHQLVKTGKTDANGEVVLRGQRYKSHFLIARKDQDVTLTLSNLYFRQQSKRRTRTEVLAYTDRSVYRPGQPLHWQVVAWTGNPQDAQLKVAPNQSVRVELRDGNNEVVVSKDVKTNAFGSAAGEFTIPTGRALGRWRLTTQYSIRGGNIRVEEYKRPTFEAELKAPAEQLRLNQPAKVTGEARYYFGLPVTAGQVKWRVQRSPVYPWWWSYWYGGGGGGTEVIATGTSPLNDEGQFDIAFTPKADERLSQGKARAVTYRYAISAEVTDEGGETRTAERSIRLGFVAVQASISTAKGFLQAGAAAEVTINRTTLAGEPAEGAGSWRLLRLKNPPEALTPAEIPIVGEKKEHHTPGDLMRPRWSHGYNPGLALQRLEDGAEVAKGEGKHNQKGEATIALAALEPGAYRMRYTTKDSFGAEAEAEQIFLVAGKTLPVETAVDMRAEESTVKVGGTARILAHSGFAGQPLILERWRDGKRVERRLITAGSDPVIAEFPVTEADRGGMGFSLQFVRDHQHVRLTQTVHVPWDDRELKVSFSTFRDTLRPGQKETWTVKIDSPRPNMASEVLAYMYDKSLDIFAPHSPPSPMGLLPWRGSTLYVNTTLVAGRRIGVSSGRFPRASGYQGLTEDRLAFLDGYGIGGPGRGGFGRGEGRFTRRRMARGDMAPMAAAAPAPEEAEAADEDSAGDDFKSADRSKNDADNRNAETTAAAPEAEPVRSNFSETAFFQPQLKVGADGQVAITFEVPDSVTAWNVWVHAISQDLSYGKAHKEVKTVKELMVRPYLPRFLREADQAHLEVVVNNAGEKALSGNLKFDIIDPETEKSVADQFGLTPKQLTVAFSAEAQKSDRKRFSVKAPSKLIPVAFKVTATAGDFSDGELRPLPILPGRVHLAQSRFTTLKGPIKKTLKFEDLEKDDDPTRIDEQLVVTLDAQLFYGVLGALPYLVNYPYECVEQTLNRFVSTGILSSLYTQYPGVAKMAKKLSARETAKERWDAPDPNRKLTLEETPWLQQSRGGPEKNFEKVLDPRIASATRKAALAKLRKAQTSLGAFPWWSGGRPSPYMTLYILHGLSKALEFKVEVPKNMVQRAWRYMKRHYLDRHLKDYIAKDCCWEFITTINYVVSNYPDASWTGGAITEADKKTMLDFSFKHWKQHSPLLKGYLALTLHRAGRVADARLVWASVLDSAKEAPDVGTFWAPEDRSWLWYNDRIETHAFALKVTMEIEPKWAKMDGLVLWLFINKKLNHWKSTRATAEVIYSLAHYLKTTGTLGIREETQVKIGERVTDFVFEPDEFSGKKNQIVVKGPDIKPKQDSTITIENKTKGFQLASATWHFSTEKMPAEAHGDFLKVTRTYYKREKTGRETTLTPLAEGTPVNVGDELEVHLSLRSKHALEYVHLRDPRGAGFEPVSLRSQHKYDLGVRWFEEVRDSATNFFFEALPKGEYTFKYRLRAATAGTFKVGPSTIQPMYAPEFTAYSAGHVLGVKSLQ